MLKKQPRGKRLRAPKNTDYYSDASGEVVDDNISIDQPDDILMENLAGKKTKYATIQEGPCLNVITCFTVKNKKRKSYLF